MIIAAILLGLSLSIDAMGVGIAYGIQGIRIPVPSKIIICFFSVLYSAFALFVGTALSGMIPKEVSKILGMSMLIIIGLWTIGKGLKDHSITGPVNNPENFDTDKSGVLDIRESLMMGFALSIDSISVGTGCALYGFNTFYIPIAVGAFQWMLLSFGGWIGTKGRKKAGNAANSRMISVLPGVILIALAFTRL